MEKSSDSVDQSFEFCCDWGMTLRDYLAGQALAGITAKVYGSKDYNGDFKFEDIADEAYLLADAMLSRRVKEPYYGK
jgi:hypothetical protein